MVTLYIAVIAIAPMIVGIVLLLTIDRWTVWKIFNPKRSLASQKIFDFIFGILAPVLCLIFDPFVFKDTFGMADPCVTPLLFDQIAIFAYTSIGLGITFLAIWLFANQWIKRASLMFAAVFFAGAGFSYTLGIILLQFSLPGGILGLLGFIPSLIGSVFGFYYGIVLLPVTLLGILGLLGFIPFLTGSVFARHGAQAWRQAIEKNPAWPELRQVYLVVIMMLVLFGFSAYVQWQIAPVPQPRAVCSAS